MAITDELHRLGNSARRLNAGSDQLNRLIERIDELLGRLMIGLDYVHPRPIDEATSMDHSGKRVIELSYVGYLRTSRSYHLAIKTVKVLESKLALATHNPGEITPLLAAPRRLRYAAVDVLPEVVSGLAASVDEMVGTLERRCHTAQALVQNLEQVAASQGVGAGTRPVSGPIAGVVEDSGVRQTVVPEDPSASGARRVLVPGEPPPGESSGRWVMPRSAATATTVLPTQSGSGASSGPEDGRRTIAMGSDLLKGQGQ